MTITELIERLEAAEGPSRELFEQAAIICGIPRTGRAMMREVIARALSEDGFAADWPHAERTAQAALDAISEAGFVIVPNQENQSD